MPRAKLGLILLVACAAACTKISTTGRPALTHASTIPGVVRIAIRGDVNTLNPVLMGLYNENYVSEALFDGLVKLDDRGNVIADLAQRVPSRANGDISPDGKTIIYHLRHGVLWQDGAPFTSADVKFTYDVTINPKTNSPAQSQYAAITRIETPDAYTVVVHLRQPFAPVFSQLFCVGGNGGIVPKHLLEHSADFNTDPFARHPIGTGPFRVSRWEPGSVIVLQPNERYFAGAPKLRELDIHLVPDANTISTMVESHELDMASTSKDQLPGIRATTGVHVETAPSASILWIELNTHQPPFDDVRVRQALTLALDRRTIVRNALGETGIPADSLIPPTSWAYAAANGSLPHDSARAAELLAAAGWVQGPDGIRRKGANQRLEFPLYTLGGSTVIASMALQAQAQWRAVGISADIKPLPGNFLYGVTGPLATGRFAAALGGFGFDVDPDRANELEARYLPPRGQNSSRYDDPQVTVWLEAARRTYDKAERARLYALVQRKVNEDVPYVPLAWSKYVYAVSDDLRGLRPETINSDLWNVKDWSI